MFRYLIVIRKKKVFLFNFLVDYVNGNDFFKFWIVLFVYKENFLLLVIYDKIY